jgi:hypothetical protein
MRFRLLNKCLIAAAIAGLLAPVAPLTSVEAQKEGAPLWFSVVKVKRVKKPNREVKPPPTQRAALLTLQWHLLQPGEGDASVEADSSRQFQTGDQVKLAVTTNQDGYLYIVSQRPGKDSVLLFPDLRINRGLNRVLKNQEYFVPSYCTGLKGLKDPKDCWMEFAAPAGTETLIVVFSRDKITTLPNKITEPGSPVKRSIVDELIASSEQKVEQFTGELSIPNQKAVRYATRVQNTNPKDNEELIATIVLTHGE